MAKISKILWQIDQKAGFWPPQPKPTNETKPPPLLARRLSPMGKETFNMLYALREDIPWVISCRYGDTSRMVRLLSSIEQKDPLSPTDFTMSVHNAIAGVFSIASKNKKMHTALSSGVHSFSAGLLETYSLSIHKNNTVGYIYYDWPLPEIYNDLRESPSEKVCIAMILDPKKGEIDLSYAPSQRAQPNKSLEDITNITHFLSSDTLQIDTPMPGGSFTFKRGTYEG